MGYHKPWVWRKERKKTTLRQNLCLANLGRAAQHALPPFYVLTSPLSLFLPPLSQRFSYHIPSVSGRQGLIINNKSKPSIRRGIFPTFNKYFSIYADKMLSQPLPSGRLVPSTQERKKTIAQIICSGSLVSALPWGYQVPGEGTGGHHDLVYWAQGDGKKDLRCDLKDE